MIALLLLPWVLGTLWAGRLLQLDEPVARWSTGLALGWLVTIMGVNFGLLAGLSLDQAVATVVGLCAAGAVATHLAVPRVASVGLGLHRAAYGFLALGALTVHFTANSILFLNPDDDFFLHAPMQGQMLKGTFPIINPFLSDIMYGGHYAKDLSTVVAARFSGSTVFGAQAPLTVALQVSAFLLLFTTIRRATGSQIQAALGVTCVFVGANAGFRGGWLDTVANNNALAQMLSALCFLLTMEALFVRPGRAATVLSGVALGGLAWAYETNFAVVSLGLCGLALSALVLGMLRRNQVVTALAIVAVALPLAMSQGGVFKNLLAKFRGGHALSASKADQTLQSQNLEVSVKFPKAQLFQIKLDRSGEEMSMAYSTLPLLRDLTKTAGAPGYVSVFSWYALRIHWLSLYLAPLSLFLLGRRRNPIGLLLWWVGCAGYLLPSVVDFGLWESEVFRWEFVAAWGFAGALGVALAQWWEELPGRCVLLERHRLEVRSKGLAGLGLAVLLVLNFYPSYHQARQRTAQLDSLASGLLFPSDETWFARQPELDLHPADLRAGLWLTREGERDQRLLTNFREENEFNVYFESSFVGLCGLRPAGHTFPLPFERLGTRPFRQSAAARAFWASGDVSLLGNLRPDWIYLRGVSASRLESLPGLQLVHQEDEKHSVFKATVPGLEVGASAPEVELEALPLPNRLEVEQYLSVPVTLRNPSDHLVELSTTLSYDLFDAEGNPVEPWERFLQPVRLRIPAGGRQVLSVHFVAPHQDGSYRVVLGLGQDVLPGDRSIQVGTRRDVTGLKLVAAEPLDPLVVGQVANYRLRLRASGRGVGSDRPVLAALVAKDSQRPLYEARDFSELRLDIPARGEGEIVLPLVVPETTNELELMLLPRDGWGVWQLPPPGAASRTD